MLKKRLFPTQLKQPIVSTTPINDLIKTMPLESLSNDDISRSLTAIVYCEGNFGGIDGKTANGLVRYSEKYEILSIIDSEKAGLDAGSVLDDEPNGIPIFARRQSPGLFHIWNRSRDRHVVTS
jgi:hypothetical protein